MMILKRRVWRMMLAAMILFGSLLPIGESGRAYADFADEPCGRSGEDPCVITTIAQLLEVDDSADNLTKNYELGADLDLGGIANWNSMAFDEPFKGTLDGNGHTISHLTIHTGGAGTNRRGLFARSENAMFRNIGLLDVSIDANNGDYIGGLVGESVRTTFENVYVAGSILGGSNVGGIAGYSGGGDFSYSYAAVSAVGIDSGFTYGGLVGKVDGIVNTTSIYYNSELTDRSAVGTPLTEDEMTNSNNYEGVGWDFSNTGNWRIIEGVTYPMHRATYNRLLMDTLEVADGSGAIAIQPGFQADQFAYKAIVPNEVTSVTVATYAEGSVSVDDGGGVESVPLDEGENPISIKVSSTGVALPGPDPLPNPIVVEYTLTIAREDGSEDYPHSITTAEQLGAIGSGNYGLDDSYQLMNDIDVADYLSAVGAGYHLGAGWDPIGDEANPFTGVFEGNKHVISNLFINRSGEDHVGLFAALAGTSEVNRLGLVHADVTGNGKTGGLAGEINGGTVTKSYVTGNVASTGDEVGGLAGSLSSGNVTESYVAAAVSGNDQVGGLIGYADHDGVTDSFWDTSINGLTASGGGSGAVGIVMADMQDKSTFQAAGWDFAGTWAMIDGTTYPMFTGAYDSVKLSSVGVGTSRGTLNWSPGTFESGKGAYTVLASEFITAVDIVASLADAGTKVVIEGTEDVSVTVPVTPGDNAIGIVTTDVNGFAQGAYAFTIRVPAPGQTGLELPIDRVYGTGDTLAFIVTYESDVDVTGTPRIPIAIDNGTGTETVYAVFTGKPIGEPNKLIFEYVVEAGLLDMDGIEVGAAIDLTGSAGITASGVAVPLGLPSADGEGITIDAKAPTIAVTQDPADGTLTQGKVKLTIAADGTGSDIAEVKWAAGLQTESYFGSGGTVLVDDFFEVETNGTYTVYARDDVGNETVEEIEIRNIETTPPRPVTGSGSGPVSEPSPQPPAVTLAPDGSVVITIDPSHLTKEKREDGTVLEKASLTDEVLQRALELLETASRSLVIIDVEDSAEAVQVQLPASSLGAVKESYPNAVFEVRLNGASFQLQTNVLDLKELAERLGVGSDLIQVHVLMEQITGAEKERLEQAAGKQGLKLVSQAVDYTLAVSAGERTIEIKDFGRTYLVRTIVLGEIAPGVRLTAVEYDPVAQKFRFVPSVLTAGSAGRQEMTMKVPHNSIYAVAEAEHRSFADLKGHWAQRDVEQLASKLIVQGVSDSLFAPDARIIRAEFTALLVRALGIGVEDGARKLTFQDVDQDDWYASAIEAGVSAGVVNGVSDSRFAPNTPITREQMAVMVAGSLSIAGRSGADASRVDSLLSKFSDRSDISSWATMAVAQAVEAGIIDGLTSHTMAPSEYATRAQAAVMLTKLLQYIEFMDQ
ncbi:S-layer homology domain-containing protein [Cohnella panacarvi]|uniref:S-layer homology domain-containing protein n=1 Tax=Cohnella panacarvi TaxID=400776 RepID=UPI00047906E1|nr:S-layer homology domain-containing protein [Cohnella panacarvi]